MVEEVVNNTPEFTKRQIAYKMQISDILDNPYKKEEGWMPNYILIGELKVSRVNIIGVIILKEEDENGSENYILSDNSGQIPLRFFKSPDYLKVGDIILLIGRPREFNSERYIVPEMMKKIEDQKWVEVRKKELKAQIIQRINPIEKTKEITNTKNIIENSESNINITISTPSDRKEEIEESKILEKEKSNDKLEESIIKSPIEKLIKIIRENDNGSGITFEEINSLTNMNDIEKMLQKLLEGGDIFEVKPGSYKVLE